MGRFGEQFPLQCRLLVKCKSGGTNTGNSFILETRRLRGDLIEVFKIFKGFDDIKPMDFFTRSFTGL